MYTAREGDERETWQEGEMKGDKRGKEPEHQKHLGGTEEERNQEKEREQEGGQRGKVQNRKEKSPSRQGGGPISRL